MGKFLFEGTATRLSLPLTGDENGVPVGEEVETGPLVGQQQRVAQRCAGEAGRSDAHTLVRAAIAPSRTIASSRGLAKIESPTHTESQPADSASAAGCSISATVVAPMTTPRLGSVSPSFTLFSGIYTIPRPT